MVYGGADGQEAPPAVTPAQSRRRVAPSPCGRRWRRSVEGGGGGGSAKPALRRTHSLTHARTRTRTQSAVGSAGSPAEGRAPTAPASPESRPRPVARAAPCAAHFHTNCRVLTWMAAGQAQQSGSVARYRQFEPARFESAPPLSQFIMKHFQDAQVTSFRENFSIRSSAGICCVLTAAQSGPKGSSNVVSKPHWDFS